MAMVMTGEQQLAAPREKVWAMLNDPAVLKSCIPGCETLDVIGENEFQAVATNKIGPVKARFKGKLELADLNPPHSYTLHFEGQGGAAGHGKGSATVRLEPAGPHATRLHYTAQASVGGKLAQVGSRLIDLAAQKLAGDFFQNFGAALLQRYGAPPAPAPVAAPAAPPGVLARLRRWFSRLLGGGRPDAAAATSEATAGHPGQTGSGPVT
jgi:carbon monoxide dehydrogenase subunit G